VFSLSQAAKFLNIRAPVLKKLAEQGRVPARKVGKAWRFSRKRLDQWMHTDREPEIALLQQAGTCEDDPDLMQILADIYKARGRPEREED
jgi:excisionase family DNA binding protein